MMHKLFKLLKKLSKSLGYEIWMQKETTEKSYSQIPPSVRYSPWLEDELFLDTYEKAKSHTLVPFYRLYELWTLVEEATKLPRGAFIEIGTWRGGSSAIIARKMLEKSMEEKLYLCDTFAGVVKTSKEDPDYTESEHSDASVENLNKVLETVGVTNYTVLKGIFPEETSSKIDSEYFRFCHIDVDIYQSAKDVFHWVWEKMVPGGIVVFDDYGAIRCKGIAKLVDELALRKDLIYIYNLNGHAIFIKKPSS